MELVNQTPVPAELVVAPIDDRLRGGALVVKASFHVVDGQLELDSDTPSPILAKDQETGLGLLPNDLHIPGDTDDFEVIVLGCARSAGPVERLDVELAIGEHHSRLHVTGDRVWLTAQGQHVLSPPSPFVCMPLVWTRAHGGSAEVWLDSTSRVPVQHPINPDGLGFHAQAAADGLVAGGLADAEEIRVDYTRAAANIEDPRALVVAPEDDPPPACWATLPPTLGLIPHMIAVWRGEGRAPYRPLQRSHPDLTLREAPLGHTVELRGCTTDRPMRFVFYPLGIEADYVVGCRRGTIVPRPQRMVLLPEENRVLVTSYAYFKFEAQMDEERSLRLRRKR